MITVTRQQMIDYCFAQPDDRKVDFSENFIGGDCGCIMVQYGEHIGLPFTGCGFSSWENDYTKVAHLVGATFAQFQPGNGVEKNLFTYGDIKKHLLNKGWLPVVEPIDVSPPDIEEDSNA